MERRVFPLRGVGATLAAVLFLNACGGGGGDDGGITNPPPPPPPAAVASVAVTLASSTINVTQTSQATAVLRDAQNNVLTGRTVTWTSSNTAVATVSATSGLVTGVAAGTANIIATSEGRTGQAPITVAAPPSPPQILRPHHHAEGAGSQPESGRRDPQSLVSTWTCPLDSTVCSRSGWTPPNSTGRPSPSPRRASSTAAPRSLRRSPVNTRSISRPRRAASRSTRTKSRRLPVIRNGNLTAVLSITPTGGQAVTQNVNFTANNPPHGDGIYKFDRATATGTDGKTYTGGDGRADVVFTTYGNEVINGFEVILTPQAAVYGHGTGGVAEVVQFITRTRPQLVHPPQGSRRAVQPDVHPGQGHDQRRHDTTRRWTIFGNAQFTTDLNRRRLRRHAAAGAGPDASRRQELRAVHATDRSTPGTLRRCAEASRSTRSTSTTSGRDNRRWPNEPVFSFLDRMTTVGGAARWPNYGFGANNSQLSTQYDFAGGSSLRPAHRRQRYRRRRRPSTSRPK